MKTINSLILISILSLSAGIASSNALERTDVEQLNSLWSNTFDEGNTEGLMTLYTDNAVVFPPSSEILEGKGEIATYLDELRNVGFSEYSISSIDMDVKGDIAYTTALWEATRVDTNGNVILLEGNITSVLERQEDGSWKIKLQSWN